MSARLAALLLAAVLIAKAQGPTVDKVEPPNWWTRTTLNPVRLLVHGSGLASAVVRAGLKTRNVKVNLRGTYLFVDVEIPRNARPGPYPLTIRTAAGTANAPFQLLDPLQSAGRFQGFSPDDVIYLIMPDRFIDGDRSNDDPAISRGLYDPADPHMYHGGDFAGIRQSIPYLKDLGVTALWLTPWYDNVNRPNEQQKANGESIADYHGYGAVDLYGVEEHFGTLNELRQLVDAAHSAGLKIIQDEVANHVGPYHPWVSDSPTPAWFHGTAAHHLNETWQLWPLIDPHSTPDLRAQTLDGWFANVLPDLNQDDPECARYLIQNTLWWIGITGMDGIRMDTLPYVPRSFWSEWIAAIHREYPKVNVVGEVFDADPALPSAFQDGALSVFDFPDFFKARDVFLGGKSIRDLAAMMAHDGLYREPQMLGTFVGNHDVMRLASLPGATPDKLKLAFTWLLTARGIPTIYYGDELGMQGGDDPDNRRDFPAAALKRSGRSPERQALFAHIQTLAQLRAATPALRTGNFTTLCATDRTWVYSRQSGDRWAVVEMNNGDAVAPIACVAPVSGLRTVVGAGTYGSDLAAMSARVSVN